MPERHIEAVNHTVYDAKWNLPSIDLAKRMKASLRSIHVYFVFISKLAYALLCCFYSRFFERLLT